MKYCMKVELKKAFLNRYFLISAIALTVFALLSAAYMIDVCGTMTPEHINEVFMRDGKMYMDPMLSVYGLYNAWIGGDSMSLIHTVFYTLLPVFAALPYAGSAFSEIKTGYVKIAVPKIGKARYFISKIVAVYASGAIVVFIALFLNFAVVSAKVPAYMPLASYRWYNHILFGQLWADLFYTKPLLYVLAYILMTSLWSGTFALMSMAVSFFVKHKFSLWIIPFMCMMMLRYLEGLYASSHPEWITEINPMDYLSTQNLSLIPKGPVILISFIILTGTSIAFILIKGLKDEII